MRLSPTPWLVASLAFLILGFTRGIHSSFGVFYIALLDTFGSSRGATAGVYSLVLAMDAILSPAVGHLLDRYGPKKIVAVGCRERSRPFPAGRRRRVPTSPNPGRPCPASLPFPALSASLTGSMTRLT